LNQKERQNNQEDIIEVINEETLHIKEKKQKVDLTKFTEKHEFNFDNVFSENNDNEYIYETVLNP
jgi:kinesin family protein 2/24